MRFNQVNDVSASVPADVASVTDCSPVVPSTRVSSSFVSVPARANVVIAFAIAGVVPVMAILPGIFLSLSRIERRNCSIPGAASPATATSK